MKQLKDKFGNKMSLNVAYSTTEWLFGLFTGCVGLVLDAVHLTFGCGLLTFLLFVMAASRKKADQEYTYGYKRLEVLSAFTNAFYQQEASKFKRQIRDIQNLNRHILGEALSSLSLKELKNLESRLEKGLSRVRSRKSNEGLSRSVLLLFKNSFNTPSILETWINGTVCCEWDGVTCDIISGHVMDLNLSLLNLQGQSYPNCTIFSLSHLQQLDLSSNYFFGDISSTISHLSKLQSLDLSFNSVRMRLDSYSWNKLIQNATNLAELHLGGVDMSFIEDSSMSLLTYLSSSLVSLIISQTPN
ncbi:Metal tolerance protein C2 [Glycine soja]|nr:Metal tolerance protein C2 [Glycine soja]